VDWELKGVPVRIEVGPRDLATGQVTLVRRDTASKSAAPLAAVAATIPALLEEIQGDLLATATERRDARTTDVETLDEAMAATVDGFARIPWSVVAAGDGEAALRAQGVTVRCLRLPDGSPPATDDDPHTIAVVARAY
jgi:prolyl-tRNA synthetase